MKDQLNYAYLELFQLCPQFVEPVTVLLELTLDRHGVTEGGVGLVDLLHLHQAVAGRGLLAYLK